MATAGPTCERHDDVRLALDLYDLGGKQRVDHRARFLAELRLVVPQGAPVPDLLHQAAQVPRIHPDAEVERGAAFLVIRDHGRPPDHKGRGRQNPVDAAAPGPAIEPVLGGGPCHRWLYLPPGIPEGAALIDELLVHRLVRWLVKIPHQYHRPVQEKEKFPDHPGARPPGRLGDVIQVGVDEVKAGVPARFPEPPVGDHPGKG